MTTCNVDGIFEMTEPQREANNKKPLPEAICEDCGDQAYTRWFIRVKNKKFPHCTLCKECNEIFIHLSENYEIPKLDQYE